MIYFVRHGETDHNVLKISQGHYDSKLNQNGHEQAKAVAEKLKDYEFDIIYSSPLSRASVTADYINKYHNKPVVYDDRLKEYCSGIRQNTPYSQWSEQDLQKFWANPKDYGAETIQEFYDRVQEFYKEIEHSDKNILIVAHGGVYRNLMIYKLKLKVEYIKGYEIDNCDIAVIKE